MPIYEFQCGRCGHRFESYRSLSDGGKKEACPACGGSAQKLRISLFRASGSNPSGKSSCGGGPRRSPFG